MTPDSPSAADPTGSAASVEMPTVPVGEIRDFGPAPTVPSGELEPEVLAALDIVFGDQLADGVFSDDEVTAFQTLQSSADPRTAWLISDLLRFIGHSESAALLRATAEELLGIPLNPVSAWGDLVDHLIAWDIPAPTDYVKFKRTLYSLVVEDWAPFFDDTATEIDYRLWSWGGVGIDKRPFDRTDEPCNCIPAADNPKTTDAAGGDWYDDDRFVFGVEINGEARAYPRNIMEIREMVNDTLGGRDIAMPYCTLCGSAQVFFTDNLPDGVERPVMRTSGLLSRSNKIMYDINTFSVFDTFLGKALTGPLAEIGLELEQAGVVTTTWGEWKALHPNTTILAEELALGRDSDLLHTRDADGPIFPIGDVDPRLPVQEPVLGVIAESGTPVAFHVASARSILSQGGSIQVEDIILKLAGGGVRAVDADGNDLGGHQAFWFAWSQFYPDTTLWPPG
ncbi:MAG: DUF3179 domain-containing (seleno)protein [Planctomycetota bacterium]|jgi:hypothetical protein